MSIAFRLSAAALPAAAPARYLVVGQLRREAGACHKDVTS